MADLDVFTGPGTQTIQLLKEAYVTRTDLSENAVRR